MIASKSLLFLITHFIFNSTGFQTAFVSNLNHRNQHLSMRMSLVGVADSPIDFSHEELKDKTWDQVICRSNVKSGMQQCQVARGWNFFNSGDQKRISFKQENSEDVKKFLILEKKKVQGSQISDDEQLFLKQRINNPEFMRMVSYYTYNSHGTHVAGIIADENPSVTILEMVVKPLIKEVAQKVKKERIKLVKFSADKEIPMNSEQIKMMKNYMTSIAEVRSELYGKLAQFANTYKVDVVNCSFSDVDEETNIRDACKSWWMNPPPHEINDLHAMFFQKMQELISGALHDSPRTLFVFSAGNEGENMDGLFRVPACIDHEQTLTVASVNAEGELSDFSNYSKNKVHIAAPGEDIESSMLGNIKGLISGTSQAAPQVTRAAALLKDLKLDLLPGEIKYILMHTVDYKESLRDKVVSGGVLNTERAVKAVKLMIEQGLSIVEACEKSFIDN